MIAITITCGNKSLSVHNHNEETLDNISSHLGLKHLYSGSIARLFCMVNSQTLFSSVFRNNSYSSNISRFRRPGVRNKNKLHWRWSLEPGAGNNKCIEVVKEIVNKSSQDSRKAWFNVPFWNITCSFGHYLVKDINHLEGALRMSVTGFVG